MNILYEDNHLLVVDKPVGIATMGLPVGEKTLLTEARDYVKRKYNKPGNVYLGVVSRLDVPVSGIVLFARTSKAADRINEQFRNRLVEKNYYAIVEGVIQPEAGECVDRLCEDKRHKRVWIAGENDRQVIEPEGKECRLTYRRIKLVSGGRHSLLEIRLETGRKHQIRLQLAHKGHPIVGDRKYGARTNIGDGNGIRLHAGKLVVRHPTTGETLTLESPVPDVWF